MKRFFYTLFLCATLAACSGVPLRSMPRLMQLPSQLLEANPGEFMVALQVDARLVPPPGAVPLLAIKLTPRDPAAFEAVDKKLPLQVAVASAATLGLEAPPLGRRWLLYSMPTSTQAELQRIQATVRQAKANPNYKAGGSLSLGVEQDSLALAVTDTTLAQTHWETWLQTRRADGFFEVWSGTPAQLQRAAAKVK
ncbi:MAG: hypothetical protein WAW73_11895 [Rhodoferax sp.]